MNLTSSFAHTLISWYQKSARDLPWRHTRDPYKIWISEVMLQQTTVTAVIPYYQDWFKKFPDVFAVASTSEQSILKSWQGLGYYSRARNIHKTAQVLVEQYQGVFPKDEAVVRSLPGFGPYTTGAVLSIAFDQRVPIIDANVRRVVMRQLNLQGRANTSFDPQIKTFLLKVMPEKNNRCFNQAMMELGALICRSKNPNCLGCPVQASCAAYKAGLQEIIPTPKKQIINNIHVAIAVLQKGKKYFIQQRPKGGLFADLWEFPGGKLEPGETAEQALHREIMEELGIKIKVIKTLPHITQYYTQFKAMLNVWLCQCLASPKPATASKWVSLKALANYPMPSGSARIVHHLRDID